MPSKATPRQTPKPRKTARKAAPQHHALPKGYVGPAYRLPDGRVLFIGQWLKRVWAFVSMDEFGQLMYYRCAATKTELRDEAHARAALVEYGEGRKLEKIR